MAGPNPVGPAAPGTQSPIRPAQSDPLAFREALKQVSGLQFSNHALQRLQRRDISLDATQMQRLQAGVDLAARKGSRESLVLVDDLAFVVAVPSRTVITAIDQEKMKEKIFTNLDSAVIG